MKIYLAIPYTQFPEVSYKIANEMAAALMRDGHNVFSPISHSHSVNQYMPHEYRFDFDFWMGQDLPFVDWADEVWVVNIGDINKSRGVMEEIRYAKSINKPVKLVEYEVLSTIVAQDFH